MCCKKLVILLVVVIILGGCNRSSDKFVGYDIAVGTENLDPQFYTDHTAELLIINLFEGLVVKGSDGKIYPGAAKSWELSDDGLEYTFYLREDNFWQDYGDNTDRILADDFVFAFERMFDKGSISEHADDFLSIKNALKIKNGVASVADLGVKKLDDLTLKVILEHKDVSILDKLALPAAMPCNRSFFNSTRGRYGLEKELVLGNGPFGLHRWEKENRITLVKSKAYSGEKAVKLDMVDIYIGRTGFLERFLENKTHLMKVDFQVASELNQKKYNITEHDDKLWSLVFNTQSPIWTVPQLRQAVVKSADSSALEKNIATLEQAGQLSPRYSLISDSKEQPPAFDAYSALEKYNLGMRFVDAEKISSVDFYIPKGFHEQLMLPLQNGWQESLSLKFNAVVLTEEELDIKLRARDFEVMLAPIKISNDPAVVLERFTTDSKNKISGYNNELYDRGYLEAMQKVGTVEEQATAVSELENMLLNDAVVLPLYTQKAYYATVEYADDIEIYASEDMIRFHGVG